ncbi:MAG: carboxypeptidase regulatory-like domain-containing protein, partial [Parcubacteria group bacterium]|nr:carboxypeptidase regulatory-like domain-containing protein [Parcubacteria group bacterium]
MKLLKLVILTITLPWFSQVAYATSTSATINIKLCSDLDNSAGKGPFFRCTFQCGCSSATDNSEINTGGGSSGGGGGTTGVGPGPTSPAPAPVSSSGGFNPFFAPDPFDRLPRATSTDPLIARLTLGSFTFSQVGEALQNFNEQGYIRINGNKYLTVSLAADQVPDVLKTIGITVFDAADYQRSFSFVLRADDAKLAYAATVAPFGQNGIYPINIHILNYQDQSLKKLSGFLQVSGVGFLPVQAVTDLFAHVAPLAVTSGLLAGASGALAAGSSIGSIYDLYLILLRAFSAIGSFFGRGRKRKPWGTVYDSVTKRPLDPAYVSVRERGREIATAITDIDGRYSLFLPAGTYEIVVNKTHYKFPSTILAGKDHDELYDHLYHGGPVVAGGAEITALNIPL